MRVRFKLGLSAMMLALACVSGRPVNAQMSLGAPAVPANTTVGTDAKASETASAQTTYEQGAIAVKRAFARRAAVFQAGTFDQLELPASLEELFPEFGFRPPVRVAVTPLPIDSDRMGFCISARANNAQQWTGFVRAIAAQELVPAGEGCSSLSRVALPTSYPVVVESILTVDRRLIPTPTAQQDLLRLEKGEPDALQPVPMGATSIAARFAEGGGQVHEQSLYVRNVGGVGALRLLDHQATPGFSVVAHACEAVAEQQACEVQVRFTPMSEAPSTIGGRIRLLFEQVLPADAPPDLVPLKAELSASLAGLKLR